MREWVAWVCGVDKDIEFVVDRITDDDIVHSVVVDIKQCHASCVVGDGIERASSINIACACAEHVCDVGAFEWFGWWRAAAGGVA